MVPRRRATLILPAVLVFAALTVAACGGGTGTALSSPPTTDDSLTLTVQHSPAGPILATGAGDTLYDFTPDTPTHSACTSDVCVFQWPPLVVTGAVRVGPGVTSSLVGRLTRPDGSTQLTYHGHPLYTYNLDVKAGTVTGQDLNQDGGPWYVLNPQGNEIHAAFSVTG
jgi:predicted lipoprotein with Yx(FWY)xxD motif